MHYPRQAAAAAGEEGTGVARITQLELEQLRHLIGEQKLAAEKLNDYARTCRDPQLKQYAEHVARQCGDHVQRLMGFLG